jgi:hypothetical protein
VAQKLFPIVLLSLVLGLAACGGGGDAGGGSDDEAEIETAIVASVTSSDPTKCTKYETLSFVEQNANASGSKAIAHCREAAADTSGDPKEVTVSAIKVNGGKATAHVAFVGGGLNQQVVSVAIVKEGKSWKLDRITGFVKVDDEALAKTMEGLLEESVPKATKAQLKCFSDEFRGISKAKAKELLLSKSSEGLNALVQSCVSSG